MNEEFTFASDPGHGWLLVTENQLIKAGLAPGHFTPYSFKHVWDNVQVYALEEDRDAGVFINHWESKYGELMAWREWYTDGEHEVRGWTRIK